MKPWRGLEEKLYREMMARMLEEDLSVPVREDDYYYYERTEKGKPYVVHCRKKGSLSAPEEVILDENALAAGHKFFRLGGLSTSQDHRLLAYSIDVQGAESYTMYVKDLATGKLFLETFSAVDDAAAWANDNRTFFYVVVDAAKRPYRALRHTLGADPTTDAIVLDERDEKFRVSVSEARSKRFIYVASRSISSTEVRFLDASHPAGEPRIFAPRAPNIEYTIDDQGESFYILTNEGAKNFRLFKTPVSSLSRERWQEVLPHRAEVRLDGVDAFAEHLVVYERERGLKKVRIFNLADGTDHYIDFPEPIYNVSPRTNPEYKTRLLRFTYTSLVTPKSVFDYDMTARTRELKKRHEVLGGYDPSRYRSERIFARSHGGALVPISLVYRKGLARDGTHPLYLEGYGAYGYTLEPNFASVRLTLLDRGFVFAIAHVRGGEELGRDWYDQGKLLHKKNTFLDFIACAEHLIREGYTSKRGLVASGGSAGGLLMGAVANLRPDLFRAIVADVPFVDVLSTMLDPSLPLTVNEYEEWGDPREKKLYDYIKSYSPYDNVAAREYPAMLVTAGLFDPRVAFWEPAKWVAKMRAKRAGGGVLLLKTNLQAGHGGASGRYEAMKEVAFEYTFLLGLLGLGR
jgi:oligopeptidase B